jgi:hypothetical protein
MNEFDEESDDGLILAGAMQGVNPGGGSGGMHPNMMMGQQNAEGIDYSDIMKMSMNIGWI